MTTMAKAAQPKGILSSDRQSLSWAQKQEFFRLVNQGVGEKEARALAIALAKSAEVAQANRTFQYARQLNARRGGDPRALRQMAEDHRMALEALTKSGGWDESKHPRNKTGEFGEGAGGGHERHESDMKSAQKMAAEQAGRAKAAADRGDHALAAYHAERAAHWAGKQQSAARKFDAAIKRQTPFSAAKSSYAKRFVEASRQVVPPYYLDQAHKAARGAAGGDAVASNRKNASLDAMWERRNALVDEIEALNQAIDNHPGDAVAKSIAPVADVHVDVPLGSDKPRRRRKKKNIKKASEFERMETAQVLPTGEGDQRLINAARLVAGMDWEQRVGAYDVEDAWARASRQLAQDLAFYDNKLQPDDNVRQLEGLDLDLGSGQARAPGYLGLDLYPYDYGTAVHDLSLGIPTQDQSVRSIRLVNVLDYMPDYQDDATPLFKEMQRVLVHGGKIIYQGRGDLTQRGDWSQVPGLVLVNHSDTTPLYEDDEPTESDLHSQVFERVRVKVPRIYGADPTWMGAEEGGPEDIAFAIAAMGGTASASRVMEDLLTERRPRPADIRFGAAKPLMPKKNWQRIIYCVVYAPNEIDHDGEYMEPADIERMAHDAIRERVPIKVEHTGDPIGAHIVESYVAPADFVISGPYGPQPISKGSWVVAIQFTDDEEWNKVLTGAYRGISVGGRALLEQR